MVEVDEIGNRVRTLRKRAKLTMKELAEKVGTSSATMHRIETGQQGPSVVLLSAIAQSLGHPITSFLQNSCKDVQVLNHEEGVFVDSMGLRLRLLVPFGEIHDDVSISTGRLKAGDLIEPHENEGYELSYMISGHCIFYYNDEAHELGPRDAIFFSGEKPHAVEAKEDTEFLAVLFKKD